MSTGDPELVQLILQYRDFRRATERLSGIPELLSKLRQVIHMHAYTLTEDAFDMHSSGKSIRLFYKLIRYSIGLICHPLSEGILTCRLFLQARDFYVEMKWEFTSWGEFES